jgi:hypothetical protein
MISYTTGEPAGNLEAGLVASATGSVRIAVVSGGVLSVLGALVVAAALPMLWRFDARDQGGGEGGGAGGYPPAPAQPSRCRNSCSLSMPMEFPIR